MVNEETTRASSADCPKRRRCGFQCHAAATLACTLLAVIFLQAVMRFAVDAPWCEWRDPSFDIKAQRLHGLLRQSGDSAALVVMTGSSVTCYGFEARWVEKSLAPACGQPLVVYNMGNYGAGLLTQWVYLRRMLERSPKPDHVLLEFSPQLLSSGPPIELVQIAAASSTASDWEVISRFNPPEEMYPSFWMQTLVPAYAYRLGIANRHVQFLLPDDAQVQIWMADVDERGWHRELPHQSLRNRLFGASWASTIQLEPSSFQVLEGLLARSIANMFPLRSSWRRKVPPTAVSIRRTDFRRRWSPLRTYAAGTVCRLSVLSTGWTRKCSTTASTPTAAGPGFSRGAWPTR